MCWQTQPFHYSRLCHMSLRHPGIYLPAHVVRAWMWPAKLRVFSTMLLKLHVCRVYTCRQRFFWWVQIQFWVLRRCWQELLSLLIHRFMSWEFSWTRPSCLKVRLVAVTRGTIPSLGRKASCDPSWVRGIWIRCPPLSHPAWLLHCALCGAALNDNLEITNGADCCSSYVTGQT